MSDFLRAAGHHALRGLHAPSTSPPISISSSSATPSRAATRSSRRCWIGRSATARCPRPSAITFCGASRSVVIAGTHGKTTTTSLTGWLLTHGGADPSVLIGGIAENFEGSYRIGGGRDFVIEGDEYDSAFFDKTAKFLKYLPDIAVVNNIEFDHADIYPDLDAIRLAFRRFVNLVPAPRSAAARRRQRRRAARCRRTARCRVETFGLSDGADWQAHDLKADARRRRRSVCAGTGSSIGHLRAAAARRLQRAQRAGRDRRRRGRRPEHRHDGRGAARSSRASGGGWSFAARRAASRSTTTSRTIRPRLPRRSGVRSAYPDRRIWAIFEPRSATSCRQMFQEISRARSAKADQVLILPAVFRSTLPDARAALGRTSRSRDLKGGG